MDAHEAFIKAIVQYDDREYKSGRSRSRYLIYMIDDCKRDAENGIEAAIEILRIATVIMLTS